MRILRPSLRVQASGGSWRLAAGLVLLAGLALCPIPLTAQTSAEFMAHGRALYDDGNYAEAERSFQSALELGPETAELHYLLGMCAAFQGRPEEAERHLRASIRIDPAFEPGHVELGGLYFKQNRLAESVRSLRRAIDLDPKDDYARDLLGTVYFVSGARDRALAQWNKLGRPILGEWVLEGAGLRHPRLLFRELRIGPGQIIRASGLRETQRRLAKLGCFSSVSFSLRPRPDSAELADLAITGHEERGFGSGPAAAVAAGLRDIIHQTVYLDLKNLTPWAMGLRAVYRWDPAQKMGGLTVRVPHLFGTPLFGRMSLSDRRDRWSFPAPEGGVEGAEFAVTEQEIRLDLDHILSDRISLDHHLRLRRAAYQAVTGFAPPDAGTRFVWGGDYEFRLADPPGPGLTAAVGIHYDLSGSGGGGKKGFVRSVLTAKLAEARLRGVSPRGAGRLAAAAAWGWASAGTPFDECFVLGIGPDVEYPLRAYRTTADGKLGDSPVAKQFALLNLDYLHGLGRLFLTDLEGGIFFDAARIGGVPIPSPGAGPEWRTDLGICLETRLGPVAFRLSYAHSLKGQRQAVYLSTTVE